MKLSQVRVGVHLGALSAVVNSFIGGVSEGSWKLHNMSK